MADVAERTGTFEAGEVSLFYRHFGSAGGTPLVIHHGANYYDSADWIDVARQLATDREVVAYDTRGYGKSGQSPTKNYSVDANVDDCVAVLDHFGWEKAVIVGHSRGGGIAVFLAGSFPERCAGLVIVDRPMHLPLGRFAPRDGKPEVGRSHKIYPTMEDALADMSRSRNVPPGSKARARLEEIVQPVEGGFIVPGRDPDRANTIPTDQPDWRSKYEHTEIWPFLAKVTAPTMLVRGTRSDRYPPHALEKLAKEFPHIERADVASGHDVATEAPDELVRHVGRFLREKVDGPT